MYAEIAINKNVPAAYTYAVPAHLEDVLSVGHLVRIPFRTGQESGIVVNLSHDEPAFKTKSIIDWLDPQPLLSPQQIDLALWIAENTLAPIGLCVWLMLPPGFTPVSDTRYSLLNPQAEGATPEEKQIISLLLRRGDLNGKKLTALMGKANWSPAMKSLTKAGAVRSEPTLSLPTIRPKTVRYAALKINPQDIPDLLLTLGRESRRANVLEILWRAGGALPMSEILSITGYQARVVHDLAKAGLLAVAEGDEVSLLIDEAQTRQQIISTRGAEIFGQILNALAEAGGQLEVSSLYAQTGAAIRHLHRLQDEDIISLGESEIWRDPLMDADRNAPSDYAPILTDAQAEIVTHIENHMIAQAEGLPSPESGVFLLHGVTGSGKTEIYMQAVAMVLGQGRDAIILVPEIALTTQMVGRFMRRFDGLVGLIHSGLSQGERYDTWRRARAGELRVIIGARSSLFAPLSDVGLIVLDEEHDNSYKQSPPIQPFYHARAVATYYIQRQAGTLILGSATPDVGSYHQAALGNYTLLSLPNRVLAHQEADLPEDYQPIEGTEAAGRELPPVQIVDMRQELRAGHTNIFSRVLLDALHQTLAAGQQIILFLNRRGTATFVFCRDCGYIAKCPKCDTPLTFHGLRDNLLCHHCGHQAENPTQCPECSSTRIKYFGRGTEQIEKVLETEFSGARVLRWDQDTASQKGAHAAIYHSFANREADILIGTQMIAKGLDLPNVTLVGIISADTALGLPDYRAGETTFQLLTQVAGRAGRGRMPGRVILQTYQPDHYAVQAAARHDYMTFYEQEILYRQKLRWPPFSRLARILIRHEEDERAAAEAEQIAQVLQHKIQAEHFTATTLIGPIPCFFRKVDLVYRWQIIIRGQAVLDLLRGLELGQFATLDIDPTEVL